MARILALTGDPDRDNWPSVDDAATDDLCAYCEAMPDEKHHPRCPLRTEIDADDVQFCDVCGSSYVTCCACDAGEDR
jgi:hypothetical protein